MKRIRIIRTVFCCLLMLCILYGCKSNQSVESTTKQKLETTTQLSTTTETSSIEETTTNPPRTVDVNDIEIICPDELYGEDFKSIKKGNIKLIEYREGSGYHPGIDVIAEFDVEYIGRRFEDDSDYDYSKGYFSPMIYAYDSNDNLVYVKELTLFNVVNYKATGDELIQYRECVNETTDIAKIEFKNH